MKQSLLYSCMKARSELADTLLYFGLGPGHLKTKTECYS
jgi:hypothetical protein